MKVRVLSRAPENPSASAGGFSFLPVACFVAYCVHMGSPLTRILVGLAVAALGIFMTWKPDSVIGIFGRNEWGEKVFGSGGSRSFYKMVGVLVTILGFIITTDLINYFFGGLIFRLFGGMS